MVSFTGKFSRGLALFVFAAALVFGGQRAALAGPKVPFHASYSLNLEADFSGFPLVGVTSQGTIIATQLGLGTTRSISETVNLATGEGVAVHQFTAANGDTLTLSFHLIAIPTSATQFQVTGVWEVSAGTGRFAGASGSGSYHGVVDFTGPTTAAGEFELDGTISSVGSSK